MKDSKILIVGLGYVGLPLAKLISQQYFVYGYDTNKSRLNDLKNFEDKNNDVKYIEDIITTDKNSSKGLYLLDNISSDLFFDIAIVTVPTPIDKFNNPNLYYLEKASNDIAKIIRKNNIIIYESTVYPGVTEDICIPILENNSNLKVNEDFGVGYSPERFNPGDQKNNIQNIKKIVSASNIFYLQKIASFYNSFLSNEVYECESIKIAEAAKVIENTQRDINIAIVNEFAKILNHLNIDTYKVLEAASTKWSFLQFWPGLVGGHCIGVDPYYIANKSESIGYYPELIHVSRKLNESMAQYVSDQILKLMLNKNINISKSKILILGFSFKENCSDIRNTKVIDIYNFFLNISLKTDVFDPIANIFDTKEHYNLDLLNKESQLEKNYDCIILAVGHNIFKSFDIDKYKNSNPVIYDLKGFFNINQIDGRL